MEGETTWLFRSPQTANWTNIYIQDPPPQKKKKKKPQTNSSYGNCSHFWGMFGKIVKSSNIPLYYIHIYRKTHRIRIPYSKYQFIVQNTPTIPKYFRNIPCFRTFCISKNLIIDIDYIICSFCIFCNFCMFVYFYYIYIYIILLFIPTTPSWWDK